MSENQPDRTSANRRVRIFRARYYVEAHLADAEYEAAARHAATLKELGEPDADAVITEVERRRLKAQVPRAPGALWQIRGPAAAMRLLGCLFVLPIVIAAIAADANVFQILPGLTFGVVNYHLCTQLSRGCRSGVAWALLTVILFPLLAPPSLTLLHTSSRPGWPPALDLLIALEGALFWLLAVATAVWGIKNWQHFKEDTTNTPENRRMHRPLLYVILVWLGLLVILGLIGYIRIVRYGLV